MEPDDNLPHLDLEAAAERLKAFTQAPAPASLPTPPKEPEPHAPELPPAPASSTLGGHVFHIETGAIEPNPLQPRSEFDDAALEELAESIREHGIIQPLVVSKVEFPGAGGTKVAYHIIAGERRWRAAKLAALPTVPAIIREADNDHKKLELALVENIQRENLNAIEEARAYKRLMADFALSQQEVGYRLGKSPEKISNTIRLLNLPLEIQNAISAGLITEGHGRAILAIVGPERQRAMLREVLDKGYSVRQTEEYIRLLKEEAGHKPRAVVALSPEFREMIERVENVLGTKVVLKPRGDGGRLTIEYYSTEELESILKTLLEKKEKGVGLE